jgi:predicted cupin superfamily sugar epimerase
MERIPTLDEVISTLKLAPLPSEGGFYCETYRASQILQLPYGSRNASTSIFYLITPSEISTLHRVRHDEVLHFYLGDPVLMTFITEDGDISEAILGNDLLAGHLPQRVAPAGVWQGSRIHCAKIGWSLLGATVSPGFVFDDFEQGERIPLISKYPHLVDQITMLTHEPR